jgi:hypothetical protein
MNDTFILDKNSCIIKIYNNRTKKYEMDAFVDADKFGVVSKFKWSLMRRTRQVECIYLYNAKTKQYLHTMLFGKAPSGLVVDFIDRNTMNCRTSNIRFVKPNLSSHNNTARQVSSTGLKGAYYDQRKQKYYAQISILGKKIHLGQYETAIAAAKAYDIAALKQYGQDALTNEKLGLLS